MILNFNIHNIFKFRVVGENKRFLNYIEKEFEFFKVGSVSNPDLTIFIGKFNPNLKDSYVINHKYHIRKNFFYCKDSYKVVKWEVQIEGLEEKKIIVRFDGNYFSDSFLIRYIIEPLMRFKVNKRGYTFLHSSGISDGRNAILFSASKGVGKTATLLNFIQEGLLYLSDEYTMLSKDGVVYSYPTTIHIFNYNMRQCPFVFEKLNTSQKLNI